MIKLTADPAKSVRRAGLRMAIVAFAMNPKAPGGSRPPVRAAAANRRCFISSPPFMTFAGLPNGKVIACNTRDELFSHFADGSKSSRSARRSG